MAFLEHDVPAAVGVVVVEFQESVLEGLCGGAGRVNAEHFREFGRVLGGGEGLL
jgi:hypothetical protein